MRQLGVAAMAAVALAAPASAAADFPGQRPWGDPAVTDPYLAAGGAALDRLYPTAERHCATGIVVFLADDLGTAGNGTPMTAYGDACRIVVGTVWLPSAYGQYPAHKRLLCTVFAHERAHAELDLNHVDSPDDLMYHGPLSVVLPECLAAFPDPADGFVPPGSGRAAPPVPSADAVEESTERECIPAWAAHSTRAVRRQYLRFHRATARRLFKRWARARPGRAARARARGRDCTFDAAATARRATSRELQLAETPWRVR